MNKIRRALIAGPARLHENSLTEYASGVARPCVEVAVRELIDRCGGSIRFSVKVVCAKLHLANPKWLRSLRVAITRPFLNTGLKSDSIVPSHCFPKARFDPLIRSQQSWGTNTPLTSSTGLLDRWVFRQGGISQVSKAALYLRRRLRINSSRPQAR